MIKRTFFLLGLLLSYCHIVVAQDDFEEPVLLPLDSIIKINISARDTAVLDYYNLYKFSCQVEGKKLNGEIMVPKKKDALLGKTATSVRLCKVKQFVNSWQGLAGDPIEVGDYMEIKGLNGETHFFNFDPALPDVVYALCDMENATIKH